MRMSTEIMPKYSIYERKVNLFKFQLDMDNRSIIVRVPNFNEKICEPQCLYI